MVEKNYPQKYWAFISYSSKDEKWAKWLQRKLMTYRVPKKIQGKALSGIGVVGSHLKPVFRDRDALPCGPELSPALHKELGQSRYLIVICSPSSAESPWVQKEIEIFRSMDQESKILPIIVSGTPNSGDENECFPPSLRDPFTPLASDARKGKDGRQNAFLKVVAGILQVSLDDIYEADLRMRRRKSIIGSSIAAGVICLLSMLSVYALKQRKLAEETAEKERAARKRAEELLVAVRDNLSFMNHDLRGSLERYAPVDVSSDLMEQVDRLLEQLEEGVPGDSLESSPVRGGNDQDSDEKVSARDSDQRTRVLALLNKGDASLKDRRRNKKEALTSYLQAIDILEKSDRDEPQGKKTRVDLAGALLRVGKYHLSERKPDEAQRFFARALKLSQDLIQEYPDEVGLVRQLAMSHESLGRCCQSSGESELAEAQFRKALEVVKEASSNDSKNLELIHDRSVFHQRLGKFFVAQSRLAEAQTEFHQSREIRRQLLESEPENRIYRRKLMICQETIARAYLSSGELKKALKEGADFLRLARELRDLDSDNVYGQRDYSIACEWMSKIYLKQKRVEKALPLLQECLACRKAIQLKNSEALGALRDLAVVQFLLGDAHLQSMEYDQAFEFYFQAAENRLKLLKESPTNLQTVGEMRSVLLSLGAGQFYQVPPEQAYRRLKKLSLLQKKASGFASSKSFFQHILTITYGRLGDLALELDRREAAFNYYHLGKEQLEHLLKNHHEKSIYHRDHSVACQRVADFHWSQNEHEVALDMIRMAIQSQKNALLGEVVPISYQVELAQMLNCGGRWHASCPAGDKAQSQAYFKVSKKLAKTLLNEDGLDENDRKSLVELLKSM